MPTRRRPFRSALLPGLALTAAACIGSIGDDDGDGTLPGIETPPPASEAGAWTTRRLTKEQYAYTVEDVLGLELSEAQLDLLPDDQRTEGFTNNLLGLVVTSDHAEGYFDLAELIGQQVNMATVVSEHSSCQTLGEAECEQSLATSLGKAMFRRPLTDDEVADFAALFATAADEELTFEDGAELVLTAMLQSPQFLYLLEDEPENGSGQVRIVRGYDMASRVSYLLWQSSPDDTLYDAAASGELDSVEGVRAQVERLLAADRGRRATARFVRDWFALDGLADTSRADLTSEMAQALLAGAVATYQDHVWQAGEPIVAIFDSPSTQLPGFAAEWYGLTPVSDGVEPYDQGSVDERQGILTHPGVMTTISDRDLGGMVARGLFVMEHLMCRHPLEPPPDLDLSQFTSHLGPDATERDYSEDRLANDSCGACHKQFDPLAFAFERFDGIGRYSLTDEHGNELKSDGAIVVDGESIPFETVGEYVGLLAKNPDVKRCVTQKHLMFALGARADDVKGAVDTVHEEASAAGGTYEALVLAIATSDAFRTVAPESTDATEEEK